MGVEQAADLLQECAQGEGFREVDERAGAALGPGGGLGGGADEEQARVRGAETLQELPALGLRLTEAT